MCGLHGLMVVCGPYSANDSLVQCLFTHLFTLSVIHSLVHSFLHSIVDPVLVGGGTR